MDIVQVLINLIAGALGGVGAGKASPNFDLGTIGNIVSGLVGGGVLGQRFRSSQADGQVKQFGSGHDALGRFKVTSGLEGNHRAACAL